MKEKEQIIQLLKSKASLKQEVYTVTKNIFSNFQSILKKKSKHLKSQIKDNNIEISYSSEGIFESKLKFSGDTLLFHMHSNVFDFPNSHQLKKTKYIKNDLNRSFCGVINIYNFLSDSLKYNRLNDAGFMIARIFINKDLHFFVEGEGQLGFLYNDFENQIINDEYIEQIIDASMIHAINFDLEIPKINDVKVVSVHQILNMNNNQKLKTAKRMGYKLSFETNIQ